MEQTIIIDDIPPNLNEVIGMCKRHWAIYNNSKTKWKNIILKYCIDNKIQTMTPPINISIQNIYSTKRRRDPDNIILKYILDSLVEAGVILDDSFEEINSITILKPIIEKGSKKTIIKITN